MTTVVTDRFRTLLYDSLDKTVPIDPSTNLFNPAKSVHWVFFRSYAALTDSQDPRYTAVQTIADLAAVPGWSPPLTSSTPQSVGSTTPSTTTTFCIANNPFTMGGGWQPSTVVAAALVLEGTYSGTIDPVIYITDDPFEGGVVLDPADTLIARQAPAVAGNRPLFSWPVFATGQTTTVVTEGSVAVLEAPPSYELAYTRHCWLYPQRVNFVANPSFELGTNHWRASGAVTRVQGTTPVPAAPGGGAWFGRFAGSGLVVAESNTFPLTSRTTVEDLWTIQAMVRGTGQLRVGLLGWEPEVVETRSDWGDSEVWDLPPNGWLHVYALRRSGETTTGMVRFENSGGQFEVDNVLCEPDWLRDWPYFDGDSTYGARDDFAWYGGENRKGQTFSTWYNHKRAVTGRLFAWDIDSDDFVVTDEEVEAQGFVYKWVPAGVRVTPHLDVLRPGDIQEVISPVTGVVTPYKTDPNDAMGVYNPWAATQYINTPGGTVSTPDTVDMGIDGTVRVSFSARIDSIGPGFPAPITKADAVREYLYYLYAPANNSLQFSSHDPTGTTFPQFEIASPVSFGGVHTYGVEVKPNATTGVKIVDGVRTSLPTSSLALALPNNTAPVTLGAGGAEFQSRIYWAQMEAINRAQLWLNTPNNYLTVPNNANLSMPIQFEMVVRYSQADWETAPANPITNVLSYGMGGQVQMTIRVYYSARGQMFQWTGVGTGTAVGTNGDLQWNYPTGFPAGQPVWFRYRFTGNNGAGGHSMQWDYSTAQSPTEPTSWTTGGTVTKTGTVVLSTQAAKQISGTGNNVLNGRLARYILRNGFTGQSGHTWFPAITGNYGSYSRALLSSLTTQTFIVRCRFDTLPTALTPVCGWDSTHAGLYVDNLYRLYMRVLRTGDFQAIGGGYSNAIPGFAINTDYWLRGVLDIATGACTYSYSTTNTQDPTAVSWTVLGTAAAGINGGSTPLLSGSGAVIVGHNSSAGATQFKGRIYRVQEHDSGTLSYDFNFDAAALPAGVTLITAGAPAAYFQPATTTVLDVNENDAGTMTDPTHFNATTGQAVTLTSAGVVAPQADSLVWRFDATEYPGSGLIYTDPRGRVWTLSAAGAIGR